MYDAYESGRVKAGDVGIPIGMKDSCLRCGNAVKTPGRSFCSKRCHHWWLRTYGPDGNGGLGHRYNLPGYDPEDDAFGGYEEDTPLDLEKPVWGRGAGTGPVVLEMTLGARSEPTRELPLSDTADDDYDATSRPTVENLQRENARLGEQLASMTKRCEDLVRMLQAVQLFAKLALEDE